LGVPGSFPETWGGFGKWCDFWKPGEVLESGVTFGNLWGFGNPGGFWKPEGNLETHEWNF